MKVSIEIDSELIHTVVANVRSKIATKFSDEEIVQMFFEYFHEANLEVGVESELDDFIDAILAE